MLQRIDYLTSQPRQSIFKQLKSIRPLLTSWNDFPSHLHPHEWCKPETILDEFFTLQAIDAWKDSLNGLFQSAIGEGSPFTSLTEKQIGYVVLMLHRLQDAIWLLHITERIPKADDRDETGRQEERSPYITTKTRTVHHPLFIISNSSLQRIDLQEIICAISMNDQVQIHTSTGIYKPMISINQIKDILPEKEFIWINQYLAITATLSNCLPN